MYELLTSLACWTALPEIRLIGLLEMGVYFAQLGQLVSTALSCHE